MSEDLIIHPGEILLDWMNENNKSYDEVSVISGIDKTKLIGITKFEVDITLEVAEKLSKVTEVSPTFWLNLQSLYNKEKEEFVVEKTIKHFEGLQKRYIKQNNGRHCDLVKTALKALHEKAESGKWCEYCQGQKSIFYDKGNLGQWLSISIEGVDVFVETPSKYATVKFNFCPMCGRELEVKNV